MQESSQKKKGLTRRDFFAYAFMWGTILVNLAILAVYSLKFLFPSEKRTATRKIYITTTDKIGPGESRKVKDLKGREITVTHTGEEYIALSTKCTHLGCQVHWKEEEKVFYCPCHEGFFDSSGKVLKGPPPAPLPSYKVEVINQAIYIHVEEVFSGRI